MPSENSSKLKELCEKKAATFDKRQLYKLKHSQANCVKILFEITSQVYPKHKKAYEWLENTTFSQWRRIILKTGFINEFTSRGVKEIKNSRAGAFVFWENERGLIWNIGLCINKNEMYYLYPKIGFLKEQINKKKIVFIGVL